MSHASFLPPEMLSEIKDLKLLAKTVVNGLFSGIHASKMLGAGIEFSQYRSYQAGDDLRLLDWKLAARSNRYYVKQAETERQASIRFLLDASASMRYREQNHSKFDYARYLIACLGYMAYLQGDTFGLYTLNQQQINALPPRNTNTHLQRFYYILENSLAKSKWMEAQQMQQVLRQQAPRELLLLFTDFYEAKDEIHQLLHQINGKKMEVIVFHLVAPKEVKLAFDGLVEFEDLETGKKIELSPQSIRQEYAELIAQRHQSIKKQLIAKNMHHRLTFINLPLNEALRDFQKVR